MQKKDEDSTDNDEEDERRRQVVTAVVAICCPAIFQRNDPKPKNNSVHTASARKLCTRTQVEGMPSERTGNSDLSIPSGKGSRQYHAITKDDLKEALAELKDTKENTTLNCMKSTVLERELTVLERELWKDQVAACDDIIKDEESTFEEIAEANQKRKLLKRKLAAL